MILIRKTKNVLLVIIVTIILITLAIPIEATMRQKEITVTTGVIVYVDNEKINPIDANGKPVATFMYNGTTYLPVRAIANAVGREIRWNDKTKSVYIGEQKASEPVKKETSWIGRYDEYLINDNKTLSKDVYKKEHIPYLELFNDGTYKYNTNWLVGMALLSGTWNIDKNNPNLIHLSKSKGINHEIIFEKISEKELILIVEGYVKDKNERSTSRNGDVYLKVVPVVDVKMQKQIKVTTGISVFVDDKRLDLVDVNGKPVESFIYNGTTYLPVRSIANAVGKEIYWDSKTNSVYLGKNNNSEADKIKILADGSLYYNNKKYNLAYENRADLNMDGKLDNVQLFCSYDISKYCNYILKINDAIGKGEGDKVNVRFKFTDIQKGDSFMEVAVSDEGPSDDPSTTFFQYDGNTIRKIGSIEGFYGTYPGYPNLVGRVTIDGSGIVKTMTRGDILQTWFYNDEYILNDNLTLEQIPKDLYLMDTKVTVLRDITLKKSRTDNSDGITLKAGEVVTIKESDNKSWCSVVNKKGEVGWFEITKFSVIKDLGINASLVFEGLNYAD